MWPQLVTLTSSDCVSPTKLLYTDSRGTALEDQRVRNSAPLKRQRAIFGAAKFHGTALLCCTLVHEAELRYNGKLK
jgi:hypothetical protein